MDRDAFLEVVRDSVSVAEVAERIGVSQSTVYDRMRRLGVGREEFKECDFTSPTPEEIEVRSAEVRAKWTPAERSRRAGAIAPQRCSMQSFSYDRRVGLVAQGAACAD